MENCDRGSITSQVTKDRAALLTYNLPTNIIQFNIKRTTNLDIIEVYLLDDI